MGCRNCKINQAQNVPQNTPLQYWNSEKKDVVCHSCDSFKQPLSPKAFPLDIISRKEVSLPIPYSTSSRSTTVGTPAYTGSAGVYTNDIENSSIVYERYCEDENGHTRQSRVQHIQKLNSNDYYAYTHQTELYDNMQLDNAHAPTLRSIDEAVRRGFEACVHRDLSNAQNELKRAEEYIAALDTEENSTLTPVSSIQAIYDRNLGNDDHIRLNTPYSPIFKEQLEFQKIRLNNLKDTVAALMQYKANLYADKALHTVSVGDKREQYIVKAIAYNNQASLCQN